MSAFTSKIKESAAVITAIAVIGGAAASCSVWIVAQANAATNTRLDSISEQLETLEQDTVRSQLLTLMSNYPNNESEILKVARYYFKDLGGDWYMTQLFVQWASERGVDVDHIVITK